jgi:hypothetical protein
MEAVWNVAQQRGFAAEPVLSVCFDAHEVVATASLSMKHHDDQSAALRTTFVELRNAEPEECEVLVLSSELPCQ